MEEEKGWMEVNIWATDGRERVRASRIMPLGSSPLADLRRGAEEAMARVRATHPGRHWRLMDPSELQESPGTGDDVPSPGCWVAFCPGSVAPGGDGEDSVWVDSCAEPLRGPTVRRGIAVPRVGGAVGRDDGHGVKLEFVGPPLAQSEAG